MKSRPDGPLNVMIVAALSIRFHLHGNRSLKEKRRVVNELRDRLKNKFNVSIAEVDEQDRWQSLRLGFAAVGSDARYLEGLMEKLVHTVEMMNLAEVIGHELRLVRLAGGDPEAGPL